MCVDCSSSRSSNGCDCAERWMHAVAHCIHQLPQYWHCYCCKRHWQSNLQFKVCTCCKVQTCPSACHVNNVSFTFSDSSVGTSKANTL